jgi:CheY-like chemotaxis protein
MNHSTLILVVEDDKVDALTIERSLKRELKLTNPIVFAGDGEEALAYLRDPQKARPGLVLLDLNMPRLNGLELLAIMKQDPNLRTIPVVVLTTSNEERDRMKSFHLGVAGYMVKPVDYPQFVDVVKTIGLYWTVSETPN